VTKIQAQAFVYPRLSRIAQQELRVLALLICFLATLTCHGQSAATLYGAVTDAGGAAIPGAEVTATDVATSVVTKAKSDSSGNYSFPSLVPAGYSVSVEAPGFKTEVLTGIVLLVNQKARVDVHLQVGSVETKVEVTGEAPLVDTNSASVGTVIGQQQVVDLPLNVRRFGALAILVPGTVPDTNVGTSTQGGFANSGFGSPFSESTYAANGARSSSNNTLIDGVDSRNLTFGGFAVQPSPDAVQEFKIQTNIYDAAFGKTAGSTINLVTKSGTNSFHGSLYEFLRNDLLDASNYFNPIKPELRRNQYGASLGGPIWRSKKLFFFGNYEGLRQVQGQSATSLVPTVAQRAGDLSGLLTGTTANLCGAGGPPAYNYDTGQLFNPASETLTTCTTGANAGQNVLIGTPIPGNQITAIDPVAAHVLSLNPFPLPNLTGNAGVNYINSEPSTRYDDQYDARVDYDISEKDQVFGRYILGQANEVNPTTGYSTLPGFGDKLSFRGQNVAIGWTHTFGANLLNEALFGFQRDSDINNCASCPRPAGFMEAFGIQGLTPLSPSLAGFPPFDFTNFGYIGDSNYRPVVSPDMVEKYQDVVTITKGRQTIVAGADIQPWQVLGEESPYSPHGELDFNGQYASLAGELNGGVSSASDFADFLLGYPYNANRSLKFEDTNQVGGNFISLFGQDNVKFTPNLSVNFGLRWEYRRPAIDKNNNYVTLVPTGPKFSGPGNATLVTAATNALNDSFCTNPTYSYLTTTDGRCLIASSAERASLGFTGRTRQTLIFPQRHDFAPRLGIVWRPTSSDKLVVRTGYGVFFDLPNFNNQHFVDDNPVFSPSQTFITTKGQTPIATSATVFAGAGIPKLTNQFISLYVAPNYLAPYFQQWSFGIQSQLSVNWAVDIAYIGTKGTKLGNLHIAGNQAEPGTTPLQSRRPYVDLGTSLYTTSDAISNYNALQFKLTRRFTSGLSFLTAYTFAKSLDDAEGDEGFSAGAGANSNEAQDDNNLPFEYGRSYSDARQRIVGNVVYDLPFGVGKRFLSQKGILNQIVGGWEVSDITSYQTGYPFTVIGPDFSNTNSPSARPNRSCSGVGQKSVINWFNQSCFSAAGSAAVPTFGNSRRNILDAPGLSNSDLAVLRHFNVADKADVEFRSEFFDAFNTPYFAPPGNNIASPPTLGKVTQANDGRNIQFALKILF
jgi:Carboxypeptidase regulatory-like domain